MHRNLGIIIYFRVPRPSKKPFNGMEREMKRNKIDKTASILVIGAGPAGLSAAYYLKKHGFKNVTIMERLGRVGGLCCWSVSTGK